MANLPEELKHFLARYDEKPQSLALKLREIVVQELAPCHEYNFAMRSKVVLLYGASEKVIADGICSIGVFRQHVTLTFVEGVELDDPRHLLRGSGKIIDPTERTGHRQATQEKVSQRASLVLRLRRRDPAKCSRGLRAGPYVAPRNRLDPHTSALTSATSNEQRFEAH